jgi:hypothetical protein
MRAVRSSLAVTMRVPSGLNAALCTAPRCSSVATGVAKAAFHTRAVLS